jgi:methylmalonyl-CoA epimerase
VLDRIDHIGVAVSDLESAISLYGDILGMPLVHRETIETQGVEAVMLGVGDQHVELMRPLEEDSPVGRFIASRGDGLHHVAYAVGDISAALQRLKDSGVELIDAEPRPGMLGSQIAFLHPESTGRVLIELVQPAGDH